MKDWGGEKFNSVRYQHDPSRNMNRLLSLDAQAKNLVTYLHCHQERTILFPSFAKTDG
jgi:hypothetical protein